MRMSHADIVTMFADIVELYCSHEAEQGDPAKIKHLQKCLQNMVDYIGLEYQRGLQRTEPQNYVGWSERTSEGLTEIRDELLSVFKSE